MSDQWDELIKTLGFELNHLNALRDNLKKQQGLIINNHAEDLKYYLEEQKDIVNRCNQTEQYRLALLKKIEERGGIPSCQINAKQLLAHCPVEYLKVFKERFKRLKVTAYDVNSINRQNQMLLNNAVQLIDEELSLFTASKEKGLYHRSGEIKNKQYRNLFNTRG